MLPDFLTIKAELSEWLTDFFQDRLDFHMGPLSDIPRVRYFEGDRRGLTRASGETEQGSFREVSSTFFVGDAEIPTLTFESILKRLDKSAEEMAGTIARDVYKTVSNAAQNVGNTVDAKGGRVSAELILDALSKVHIDFNDDGTPQMPALHIHPNLADAVQRAGEELENQPELRRQLTQLLEQKREDWRAREASRKLVG